MRYQFSIIWCCFLMFGCEPENQGDDVVVADVYVEKLDTLSTESAVDANEPISADIVRCNCPEKEYRRNYPPTLSFGNWDRLASKNQAQFNEWSQDSLVGTVISIGFEGFDTIPSQYAVFSNVEEVRITQLKGKLHGLDMFPNLRSVHFFASEVDFDTEEAWLKQLEVLIAEKTAFSGLTSFSQIPRLKVMYLAYSGFDVFPADLQSLSCLQELTLGAYRVGKIDLNTIDLSHHPCLKKVEFQTWYNALAGLPKGILNSNVEELKVHHQQLSEVEKQALNRIQQTLKAVRKE